jgi:hypothetical protein
MIDVFIVAKNDMANVGYRVYKSLLTTGIKVEGMILKKHQFKYPQQLSIGDIKNMKNKCLKAKIVWFITGDLNLFKRLQSSIKGKIVITYPGSIYRRNRERYNKELNPFISKHIAVSTDMMETGAKNSVYNGMKAFDVDFLIPKYNNREIPIIGHFPSDPNKKGTGVIVRVLEKLVSKYKFYVDVGDSKVTYLANMRRMQNCDILIEQLFPKMAGMDMGILGMQAFEASCLGNIVVSNLLRPKYYKNRYGNMEIEIANTEEKLEQVLSDILEMGVKERTEKQKQTRKWVVNKHSFEAMGKEILNDLEEYL